MPQNVEIDVTQEQISSEHEISTSDDEVGMAFDELK